MKNGLLLEVIACSVEDAVAAAAGGADRLELISHYEVGGLTPPRELVRQVLDAVSIPVRVMLRDEESFFITDPERRAALCRTARELAALPLDGVVLGFLRRGGDGQVAIDLELLEAVLSAMPQLPVTFHRATEELADPGTAIEILRPYAQIDTLLTSGGPEPWAAKTARFNDWVRRAAPAQTILVGGGVDEAAIRALRPLTPLHAFHVGQAVRVERLIDGPVIAERVAAIAELLASFGPVPPPAEHSSGAV